MKLIFSDISKKFLSLLLLLLVIWKEIKRNSKYSSYNLITSIGTNIVINTLEFDVASMQYQLRSFPIQLPSSGLIRNYTVAFIDSSGDNFFVGTTGGEICIFNITNQVFKAAIQVFIIIT